jgi:hypothetical protein
MCKNLPNARPNLTDPFGTFRLLLKSIYVIMRLFISDDTTLHNTLRNNYHQTSKVMINNTPFGVTPRFQSSSRIMTNIFHSVGYITSILILSDSTRNKLNFTWISSNRILIHGISTTVFILV